jgi:hypothetical protein
MFILRPILIRVVIPADQSGQISGVDVKRVTDEAHFTEDLGADGLTVTEEGHQ